MAIISTKTAISFMSVAILAAFALSTDVSAASSGSHSGGGGSSGSNASGGGSSGSHSDHDDSHDSTQEDGEHGGKGKGPKYKGGERSTGKGGSGGRIEDLVFRGNGARKGDKGVKGGSGSDHEDDGHTHE